MGTGIPPPTWALPLPAQTYTKGEAEKVLLHWSLPYLLLVFGTLRPQCEEAQASLLEDETMDSREACPAEAPQHTPRPIPHPYNWPANCS